jgi:hypothetical protein
VRFAAAEALGYLDCTAGGEELARLAERYPALRAYCLTALASMGEAVCYLKLNELLASANSEMRYGAFRALRLLEDGSEGIQGELLGENFWLHKVAPQSPPLIHLSTSRRAELVFFGAAPRLVPPFKIMAAEFTITAEPRDDRCTVSRYVLNPPSMRRGQCSFALEDVLRTMADMGGVYGDAVELVRQADHRKCLTAAVQADALPMVVSVEELAAEGKKRKHLVDPEEPVPPHLSYQRVHGGIGP